MQPSEVLLAGAEIVSAALPGFRFTLGESGVGSGGAFASGQFAKGDRRLELHFRSSLGLVTYHLGDCSLSHEAYVRALGVALGENHYPGFSDDPLDGFRHLAHDLERFASEFVSGDGAVLQRSAPEGAARLVEAWERSKAGSEGDDVARAMARAHFHAGEYERVVRLLGDVRYQKFLTESERRMLAIARVRAVV